MSTSSSIEGRVALLRRVPLFEAFNADELQALAELFVEVSYRRGDTICHEGEEGDTFFVTVSGELEVWGGSPRQVINRLGPGEVLGEMSLLLGGKRAATVTAARSARLLALNRAAFERYFLHNAKVLEYFSKVLTRRLATMARGESVARSTTTLAVTAAPGLRGRTLVATSVAAVLADASGREAAHVFLHAGPERLGAPSLAELARGPADAVLRLARDSGAGFASLAIAMAPESNSGTAEDLASLVERLEGRFRILVLEIDARVPGLTTAAEAVADAIVRIVDQPTEAGRETNGIGPRVFEVVNLQNATSCPVAISHCAPYVLRPDPALRDLDPIAQASYVRTHPCSPAGRALHRLARKTLGASVGIALGGGAAFGIAHVGVLKVLEDNGIPVDMVVGCSMGSLIAFGYAVGMRSTDMIDIALRIGNRRTLLSAMMDFTLTKPGLIAGGKIVKLLGPLAGDVTDFEQLHMPCRVVATDILTGERVSLSTGPTIIAGLASCSIPLLISPVMHQGRILVDGGIVDPVPAEVVREMGADIVLAVNAVPRLKKGVETVITTWYRRMKMLDPLSYLAGSQGLPNMLDIFMNTLQALQHELGNFKAISADVRIDADLSGLTWIEFYRPQEFIDRGIEAAERALPEIKRVYAERLAGGPVARQETPMAAGADAGR